VQLSAAGTCCLQDGVFVAVAQFGHSLGARYAANEDEADVADEPEHDHHALQQYGFVAAVHNIPSSATALWVPFKWVKEMMGVAHATS